MRRVATPREHPTPRGSGLLHLTRYPIVERISAARQQPVAQAQRRGTQGGAGGGGCFVQRPAGIGRVGLQTFDVDVYAFASQQPLQLDDLDKGPVAAIALNMRSRIGGVGGSGWVVRKGLGCQHDETLTALPCAWLTADWGASPRIQGEFPLNFHDAG